MDKQKESNQTEKTIVLLIRHATNDWVESGKLAGRIPGIHLNEKGRGEAEKLAQRLEKWPVKAIYSSPLERAQETAGPIATACNLPLQTSTGIGEVDYGEWAGQDLKKLSETQLWRLVKTRPSAVRFPNGESLHELQIRAVAEVEHFVDKHRGNMFALVSHGDVIKMILAYFLGLHLDLYQRLFIRPASISIISFSPVGAYILSVNDSSHLEMIPDAQTE